MRRRRRPVLDARAGLLALGLALAGSFVAACQANQPSQPPVSGDRQPTPEEAVKLIAALGTYEQAAQLEAALQPWKQRERILSAERSWDHFQGLVKALANRAARLEFVAFVTSRNPVTGSVGALGGRGVLAAPRILPTTVFRAAAANQCAFVLPGQEPLSRPALRWLASGDAVDEEESPLRQELRDWLENDPGPVPLTEAEIQAYGQWTETDPGPIPMTAEEIAWAEQQRPETDPGPIPMTDEEIAAIREAAGDAPPFSGELLAWLEEYEQDSAPQPMTEEEIAWAEQQQSDADPGPIPMTEEEIAWVEQWESDADPGPVPMTEEEIAWVEQQRADSGAPVPMTEAEIQAYEQWVQDGAPVPMTDEEIQQYGQWEDDGAPIPMTEEEIAWVESQRSDTDPGPIPMTPEEIAALEQWGSEVDPGPVPMTEEEIAWVEQHTADTDPGPVPMTDEEIQAVEEAARNRTLGLSDEEWARILEQNGIGSPSSTPQPTPQRCDWYLDHGNAQGHVKGQKCGGAAGVWILEGTYHPRGFGTFEGEQKWTITINADWRTGTFVYETEAQGQFVGAPVTVYLLEDAEGTVTLTVRDDGIAHMEFVETTHTYLATTDLGGEGENINVALETYKQDWAVGGTC